MSTIIENLYGRLTQKGMECRVLPAKHLKDLQNEIEAEYAQGHLAEEFYRERMQFYQFSPPEDFPAAISIIVVAVPRPQTPVHFWLNEKSITLTLPPTYAGYEAIVRQVGEFLSTILAPAGYHTTPTRLPLKLLASCSGLVEYGRNNIGYIAGMGSFFQLAAYFTDLPSEEDVWQNPRLMERCKTCQACLKKCPTGAITPDRFLLHAERCLVFHNERSALHPFPAWIEPGMHNCLMGCMLCQQYCPEDKPFLGWFEEEVEFSTEETQMLIQGTTSDNLPMLTRKKLEYLELTGDLDKLPRNLRVFFEEKSPPG